MFKHYFALFLALISVTLVFAEDKAAAPKEKAATEAKPSAPAAKADTKDAKDTAEPGDVQRAGEASFNIGGMKISLQDAINMVLEKNLTLQAAKYDVVMTDTNQRKLEKKYAPIISADARHLDFSSSPLGTLSTQAYQNDITASISKLFSTGTTVGGGYRMQNVQAQAIPSFGFAKPKLGIACACTFCMR